jgi:4'-phosphopantetheinyl transferase EntD
VIEALLPGSVVVEETVADLMDVELFPEEEQAVGRAVEKRRREFVTGRACARRALGRLGIAPTPIGSGERGQPLWPAGVVGSITHCRGYRACAVAPRKELASVGIDAEVHEPLPAGILESIASPKERLQVANGDRGTCLDRVMFSAKEAVYKAWFPLTEKWLGFEDVDMTIDPGEATFRARLLVPGPVVGEERLTDFRGRWLTEDGVVLTAVAVAAPDAQ